MTNNSSTSFPRLYLNNINENTTREEITELFSQYGKVIRVMLFLQRQYGYIELEKEEERQQVLKAYQEDNLNSITTTGREQSTFKFSTFHNPHLILDLYPVNHLTLIEQKQEKEESSNYIKLFLSCIPLKLEKQKIHDFFQKYSKIQKIYIANDDPKQTTGFGFITIVQTNQILQMLNTLQVIDPINNYSIRITLCREDKGKNKNNSNTSTYTYKKRKEATIEQNRPTKYDLQKRRRSRSKSPLPLASSPPIYSTYSYPPGPLPPLPYYPPGPPPQEQIDYSALAKLKEYFSSSAYIPPSSGPPYNNLPSSSGPPPPPSPYPPYYSSAPYYSYPPAPYNYPSVPPPPSFVNRNEYPPYIQH